MLVETIEGIVLLCIASIGIVGNIIAIPYFASRIHRQKTFYQLLTCLSICDLIVVTNGTLLYGLPKVSNSYGSGTYFIIAPFVFPLFEMGSTGGIYATMAICIERYFVVCRPLWYRAQATPSRTYTIPILLFSIIYNIPRFLFNLYLLRAIMYVRIFAVFMTRFYASFYFVNRLDVSNGEYLMR